MGQSEFVDLIKPLHDRLRHYDPTKSPTAQSDNDAVYDTDPARAVPQSFLDAMIVRERVYVQEQNIPLENELDEDDARSFHWVVYASMPLKAATNSNGAAGGGGGGGAERKGSGSTKMPIGTIRLVPPPHAPHPLGTHGSDEAKEGHEPSEPYVKLGRLAVIPEFRKAGISKLLIETALSYAKAHPYEVGPLLDPASMEALKKGVAISWKGLVLVHAQVGVQKVWRKYGFETDESMGTWDEEGIDHVAMWRRVSVDQGRRTSKIWLNNS